MYCVPHESRALVCTQLRESHTLVPCKCTAQTSIVYTSYGKRAAADMSKADNHSETNLRHAYPYSTGAEVSLSRCAPGVCLEDPTLSLMAPITVLWGRAVQHAEQVPRRAVTRSYSTSQLFGVAFAHPHILQLKQ